MRLDHGRPVTLNSRAFGASLAVVAAALLGVVSVPSVAGASAAPRSPALVLSARAAPAAIPASGATVVVAADVAHSASCQLELLTPEPFPVVFSHNPKPCGSGPYSARVTIGPNSGTAPAEVAFALVARNSASAYPGRFYVRIAGISPAAVLYASATPAAVPHSGATVSVTGRLAHATSCQLVLLSRQSFPVVYSRNPKACSGGSYSAHVTIGPNPTAVARTVAFEIVARNVASSFAGRFYVRMAATPPSEVKPASRTTVPSGAPPPPGVPPTTTVPVIASSVPVSRQESSNWSGWASVGGPYSAARGTFSVPSVVQGDASLSQVAQWVGLDGLSPGDTALIQAGVDEVPDPASTTGFDIQPWWEILPAQETDITSVNVNPGDKVTVTIWKVSSASWEINLTDDTNSESFTTPPEPYSGKGSTAEWVVEATTQCQQYCATTQLASYSPAITFSSLGMTGPAASSLDEITMVQGDQPVSTPSDLSGARFTVTYTGP